MKNFTSQADKKRATENLSREYSAARTEVTRNLLDRRAAGTLNDADFDVLYYALPHDLHNYRAVKFDTLFAAYPVQVATFNRLVAERLAVKSAPIVAKQSKAAVARAEVAETVATIDPAAKSALVAGIEAYRPVIEARYSGQVEYMFANLVERFGPKLKGASNSRSYRTLETVRPSLTECKLDAVKLAKNATHYAKAVSEEWLYKIVGKLEKIEDVKVLRMDGLTFNITGTRNGKSVRIVQTMTLNVSALGTLFNQFPARIYVDGKFLSEKAYKASF